MPRKIGFVPSDDEPYGDEGYELDTETVEVLPLWVDTPDYGEEDDD